MQMRRINFWLLPHLPVSFAVTAPCVPVLTKGCLRVPWLSYPHATTPPNLKRLFWNWQSSRCIQVALPFGPFSCTTISPAPPVKHGAPHAYLQEKVLVSLEICVRSPRARISTFGPSASLVSGTQWDSGNVRLSQGIFSEGYTRLHWSPKWKLRSIRLLEYPSIHEVHPLTFPPILSSNNSTEWSLLASTETAGGYD